jgi:UDPglucose--hexose-1-phosphate uridylyltransferase
MPTPFDPAEHPHQRYDPLAGRWCLVSPHRAKRPWQGQRDEPDTAALPAYDPTCYLCPGNVRASGDLNPAYDGCFVFDNDFPALLDETPAPTETDPLFQISAARGTTRVICYSPDHGKSLAELSIGEIGHVIETWCHEAAVLGARYRYAQIFENKGAAMGCSNPHPHGQVWASDFLPDAIVTECRTQAAWLDIHGAPMLLMLSARESGGPRIVVETEYWQAIVPWWAVWPFETLVLPRFAVSRLPDLSVAHRADLARLLQDLTVRYDNLFETSFPYSFGWHSAPTDGQDHPGFQLHAHFYPPLLRSAGVRKFMVGYEMLAQAQRDLTPEQAAEQLRGQSARHYRHG